MHSYLWVLETNTGATWRTGYLRLVSFENNDFHLYQFLISAYIAWDVLWCTVCIYRKHDFLKYSNTTT